MTLAGLVGVNQGYVGYSTSSGQVDFRRNLSQSFGGLAGINYGTMVGNFTWGQASQFKRMADRARGTVGLRKDRRDLEQPPSVGYHNPRGFSLIHLVFLGLVEVVIGLA
ncbi:hypothetical protein G6F31_018320 [Rhizopus arrhizus]|nr:hypothetical protein G6F31_018320 [Rhizopus arrhizus]